MRSHLFFAYLLLGLLFSYPLFSLAADNNVVQVTIQGLEEPLLSNVRALLSLEKQKQNPRLTSNAIKRMHREAETEIRQALEPFGYYQPAITAELIEPETEGVVWQARYDIAAGPLMLIKDINIELIGDSDGDAHLKHLLHQFPLREGDPVKHIEYEQGKKELLNAAQDYGYLEAAYQRSEIVVDMAAYQAHINLILDIGARFRFGAVTFEQDTFEESVLRNFLTFEQGDYYSAKKYAAFRNALGNSGYFEQITIDRAPLDNVERTHYEIPLTVKLIPMKKNKYRIRLGYGTDTQLRTKLDWERRYVNRYGHRLNAGIVGVQDQRRFVSSLDYLIPVEDLDRDYWNLGFRYEGYDYSFDDAGLDEGGETRLQSLSLLGGRNYPRKLFNRWSVQENLSLEYLLEDYDLVNLLFDDINTQKFFRENYPEANKALNPSLKTLIPGISWHYVKADKRNAFTHRGQQLDLSLKGAIDGMLSTSSFLQARVRGKYIRNAFNTRNRIIFRTDIAYTEANTVDIFGVSAHELPQSQQFRTGGDRSVRGYSFESLKSKDSLVYGKHLLVGSLEFEQLVLDDWSGAVFYDTGNAFNSFSEMELHDSVGLGIRWYSPVGPVRLDIAHPLGDDTADSFRIHINIGPDFDL